MPIIDYKTGKTKKDYTIKELIEKAKEMRAYNMVAITAAGSGHTGGTLSIMDITAALYLKEINHDPANPDWEDRDRVFWSVGHKAPAIYIALGEAGYFDLDEVVKLRKLWSGFEGHPNRFKLPGLELSCGSLGQGLGVAVGCALNARLEKKDYRTFCILGDGELNEGSVWESAMSAAHYKLDSLIAIVDRNNLQIDGPTEEVMQLESLLSKWQSFGWHTLEIDGHDMTEILKSFEKAKNLKGKPTVVIAHTVKGKGVSYAENIVGYHGVCPKDGRKGAESLEKALQDINAKNFDEKKTDALLQKACSYQEEVNQKIDKTMPKFKQDYWWNKAENMKVKMVPTRNGFGDAIEKLGESKSVVAFGADITNSICMNRFYENHPERKERFFTVCYNNFNVKIANAHAGLSVGADGATHQALEEISNMYYLPNMHLIVPSDSLETEKGTTAVAKIHGPAVIRYAREATPVISKEDTPYAFGKANVIRFREEKEEFVDAFETKLASDYQSEKEDVCIIACGPMVAEAMRAAYILKTEYNLETRILNIHTVKPLDKESILKAAEEIGLVMTVEEHQKGGFGNIIAGVIATGKKYNTPLLLEMMGVDDQFGSTGAPWELLMTFGLTAEHIAKKTKALCEKKG